MDCLESLSQELLIARGAYSTIRALHEDRKADLSKLCGVLTSLASQILRHMQPGNAIQPGSVADLFTEARLTIEKMDDCATDIAELARQRIELKPLAWGK